MMTEVAESGGKPSSLPVPLPNNSNALNTDEPRSGTNTLKPYLKVGDLSCTVAAWWVTCGTDTKRDPTRRRSGGDQIPSPQQPVPQYNPYQQFIATRPAEQNRASPQTNLPPRPELRNYGNPIVRPSAQGYPPPANWNRQPAPSPPPPKGVDPRNSPGFRPAPPPDYRPPPGSSPDPSRSPRPQTPQQLPTDYRFQNPEYRPQGPPPPQDYRLKTPPGPPQTLKYRQPINPEYRPPRPPIGQPPRPSGPDPRLPLEQVYKPAAGQGTAEYRPPYRPQEYQPPPRRDNNEAIDNGDYYEKQKKVTFDPNVQKSDSGLQSPTSETARAATPPTSIIRRQSAWAILKEKLPEPGRLQNAAQSGAVEYQQKSTLEYIRTGGQAPNMSSSTIPYPGRMESPKPPPPRVATPTSIGSDNSVVEGKIPNEMIRMNSKQLMSPATRGESGRETPTRGAMTPDGRDSPTTMHYPPPGGSYRPATSPQYMVRRDSNEKHMMDPRPSTGGIDSRGRETPPVGGMRGRVPEDDDDVIQTDRGIRYTNSQPNATPPFGPAAKPRTPGPPDLGGNRPDSPAQKMIDGPPDLYRSKPGTPRTGSPMIQRLDSRASIYNEPVEKSYGEPAPRSPLGKTPLPPKPPTPGRYPESLQSPTGQGPRPPDIRRIDDGTYPKSADPALNYGSRSGPPPDYMTRTPPRTPTSRPMQNGAEMYSRVEDPGRADREHFEPAQIRIQKPDSLDLHSVTNGGMMNGVRIMNQKSRAVIEDGGHNNGIHEKKEPSTNGDYKSPLKSPTKIPGLKKSPSTRIPKTPTRAGPKTPDEANDAQEKKKVPMNKIQVGAAPSPNLKTVRSKIGSLDNTSYKPGGGKVKIESKKLDWKAAPRIAAKNENYQPTGGDKKIPQQKLVWNAKSKIGSLENTTHKPGGGDKKIETIKLDFKGNAKPKIGSKENVKHMPGGGTVKNARHSRRTRPDNGCHIEEHKLDIKASSKIGSLDNVKYKPGGGDKKIFDDKEYLKQMAATSGAAVARSDSEQASASQNRSKSTSRKSSRDRKSPIHLLPNGGIGLAPKSSAEDGNSEKKPIDRPSGSSPLSDKEKGKANESSGSPKTPVDAEAEKIVSSEPPKINASSKPDTTIKGTDKNDNDINQKQSTATSKSEEKPTLKEETPSVAVAKPSPEKTVIKKEPIPSTPPKPEETSVGLDKSPRPESRGLDGPKTPKPEPEKLISTEVAPNNRQRVGETIDSNKPTVVKTEIGSLNKPQSGSIDSISKPGTPLPPLPASAKPPTAPDLTNSKPPTPNTEQSGNQSGSNSQPGSKPMTPNPDTKPTDEKAVPPPTPQPRDIDAKPGTPQTGGNVVAGQPRPVFRPPTGERRTDGSVATQRQQSPDFSPKFGVREPLSKDSQGKRMVSSPSTDDQDVGVGRPPQSSPALRREAMSPGKRPDFRNDPMNMRPKTSDAKLQDPQRDSSKVMKNLENASQRQEQYQSMRNLADRSGSPKVGASTEGSQDLQRAASPNPVKSVVMPPKDG